jgi:hypothetical protein
MELDHHHGGGSLALCHRGDVKSDAYPLGHYGARRHHGEIVPCAWICHLD